MNLDTIPQTVEDAAAWVHELEQLLTGPQPDKDFITSGIELVLADSNAVGLLAESGAKLEPLAVAFNRIKRKTLGGKLIKAVDRARAKLQHEEGFEPRSIYVTLADLLIGHVLPDLMEPFGYGVEPGGVFNKKTEKRVVSFPLVVTARLRQAGSGHATHARLEWFLGGCWSHGTFCLADLATRSKAAEALAQYGLFEPADHVGALLTYIRAALGARGVKFGTYTRETGLTPCGRYYVLSDGRTVSALGIHAPEPPPHQWLPGQPLLIGYPTGTTHAVGGSSDVSLALIRQAVQYPVPAIAVAASLAPCLLPFLGGLGFSVDVSGTTSRGKSTAIGLAASLWGYPSSEGGSLIEQWTTTGNALAIHVSAQRHSPAFVDDAAGEVDAVELGKKLTRLFYMVGNGRDRGRSNRMGTTIYEGRKASTVLICTGEAKSTGYTNRAGAAARVLPFPQDVEIFPDGDPFAKALIRQVRQHYGHWGPFFQHRVLQATQEGADWLVELHRQWERIFEAEISTNYGGRGANYAAILMVALILANHWMLLGLDADTILRAKAAVLEAVHGTEDDADVPTQALDTIATELLANIHAFTNHGRTAAYPPPGGWWGAVCPWGHPELLAIRPGRLHDVLAQHGFDAKAVMTSWAAKGDLLTERPNGTPGYRGRYFGFRLDPGAGPTNLIVLRLPWVEDAEATRGEV